MPLVPASCDVGVIDATVVAGFSSAKLAELEKPGVGVGFCTLTVRNVPALPVTSDGKTTAVNWLESTNVVTRLVPFRNTVAPDIKLLPFTISVNPPVPATTAVGLNDETAGVGFNTVSATLLVLVPAFGAGFCTVIDVNAPALVKSDARIAAVNCVALTNVVTRLAPFTKTVAPETKFVPFTVRVNPTPPTTTAVGLNEVTVGVGFWTANGRLLEVPPPVAPGVETVTVALVVAPPRDVDETVAINCVLLTKVVGRLVPFNCTVDPCTKLLPVTVSVTLVAPKVTTVGVID